MTERISGKTKIWEILNFILPSEGRRPKEKFIPTPLPGELVDKVNIITPDQIQTPRKVESALDHIRKQMEFENLTVDEVFKHDS